jgi:hypothetical protein
MKEKGKEWWLDSFAKRHGFHWYGEHEQRERQAYRNKRHGGNP